MSLEKWLIFFWSPGWRPLFRWWSPIKKSGRHGDHLRPSLKNGRYPQRKAFNTGWYSLRCQKVFLHKREARRYRSLLLISADKLAIPDDFELYLKDIHI